MSKDAALTGLLRHLKQSGYSFTTVTPTTHARVLARPAPSKPSLRDIFGWSRPFQTQDLPDNLLVPLQESGALVEEEEWLRSAYRVSSLGSDLFLHSAFPTDGADSVFFGPDTYRFARFIRSALPALPRPDTILDMGTGSGAGGISAARLVPEAKLTLVDMNPVALALAAVNADAAGLAARLVEADSLPCAADLILANPPYMMDGSARAYRDGGGLLGGEVALRWAGQALQLMRRGSVMLLYTGAAACNGEFPLMRALEQLCREADASLSTDELDPDVFGEELEQPAYAQVERIAAIGAVITKR